MARRALWLSSVAPKSLTGLFLGLLLTLAPSLLAQTVPDSDKDKKPEVKLEEPVMWGDYEVHSSIELGGRATDFTGNQLIEQTFVNQRDGFRILDQSLDLRSVHHGGMLFDELHFGSSGFFGEPNTLSHLSLSKQKWYDFAASFRRDLNYWDYTLQANPLNPVASNPALVVTTSPHAFHTARNMQDYRLTLMPQSRFRVRLNYGNNFNNGPTLSSVHQGTDTLLDQMWRNRLDSYNVGFDFRFIPRTNISYDQFVSAFRGDTYTADHGLGNYQLSNGQPVDLGLIFDSVTVPASPIPCKNPIASTVTNPDTANPTCNAYLSYNRAVPTRTVTPTEQLTFQSSYFKRVDLSGRFSYSSSEMGASNEFESFLGRITRSNGRGIFATGPAYAKRVSVNGDFAVTIDITKKIRFVDNFRWASFRIPGTWDRFELDTFSPTLLTNANIFDPVACKASAAACPQHTASSGADVILQNVNRFLGQKGPTNTVEIEADINKYVGGSIGYRYRDREINQRIFDLAVQTFFPTLPNRGACVGQPLDPVTGACTVMTFNGVALANVVSPTDVLEPDEDHIDITEHSLLFGFWVRPVSWWRSSFDMEVMTADETFTRIGPRNRDLFRFRTRLKPRKWLSVGGSMYWLEQRNPQFDVQNDQHNRNVSISAVIAPQKKWSMDLNYGYTDVFSSILICYVDYMGVAPKKGATSCGGAPFLSGTSMYTNTGHYVSGNFTLDPIKDLHLGAGYTLNSYDGSNLLLNPNAPVGPLRQNYHLPNASIAYDFAKRWTGRAAWNFYEYKEKGDPGAIPSRDFRGNMFTMGVRYAF